MLLMDAAANALCLCMALRMMGRRIRPLRVGAAAMCGALIALFVRTIPISRGFAALFWLPAACMMGKVACGSWSLRAGGLLMAACGLLGGTMTAIAGATGSLAAAWGIGAAAVMLMGMQAARARRASGDILRLSLTVTVHGRSVSLEGIVDSGNSLRDYLTHRPVIVLPQAAGKRLLTKGQALRPIFADTAGGRQMMDCLTPERVIFNAEGKTWQAPAIVAFSPGLPANAPALVPAALLDAGNEKT